MIVLPLICRDVLPLICSNVNEDHTTPSSCYHNKNIAFHFQEIIQDPRFFVDGATRFDIQQGELGEFSPALFNFSGKIYYVVPWVPCSIRIQRNF